MPTIKPRNRIMDYNLKNSTIKPQELGKNKISAIILFLFLTGSFNANSKDILELIEPTGRWYKYATASIHQEDGCGEFNSTTTYDYQNLYSSLIEAKQNLFNQNYKGGQCNETIVEDTISEPEDWPIVDNNTWPAYKH